ncbi:MAG: hypothetical protein CMQ51_00365 [Gammaproteobacteria bacterium]|nr:hypothetical protein [Gammaproteobacteria bacterium]
MNNTIKYVIQPTKASYNQTLISYVKTLLITFSLILIQAGCTSQSPQSSRNTTTMDSLQPLEQNNLMLTTSIPTEFPNETKIFTPTPQNSNVGVTTTPKSTHSNLQTNNTFNGLPCVTSPNLNLKFSNFVVESTQIKHTAPPGSVNSGMLKRHAYFFVGSGLPATVWDGYPQSVPVFAPTDSWLRQVQVYEQSILGNTVLEYELVLEASCNIWYRLGHLGPVSDKIKDLSIGYNYMNEPILFESGEIISYWSGINPGGNIDFGVYNTSTINTFTNQARYTDGLNDHQLYEDCPFNYFNQEIQQLFYQKLSEEITFSPVTTTECRKSSDQDIAGSISGEWFEENNFAPTVSIGSSLLGSARFTTRDLEVSIDPKNTTYVHPSKVSSNHCYYSDNANIYIDLDLIDPLTLIVSYGEGTCSNKKSATNLQLYK